MSLKIINRDIRVSGQSYYSGIHILQHTLNYQLLRKHIQNLPYILKIREMHYEYVYKTKYFLKNIQSSHLKTYLANFSSGVVSYVLVPATRFKNFNKLALSGCLLFRGLRAAEGTAGQYRASKAIQCPFSGFPTYVCVILALSVVTQSGVIVLVHLIFFENKLHNRCFVFI